MKATATVIPEATPFTLLGQSSPSSSQGIVPTPAPNTENSLVGKNIKFTGKLEPLCFGPFLCLS